MASELRRNFGIDFGTTNSAVVEFMRMDDAEQSKTYYGDNEGRPIPSIIAIDKETGEVFSGRDAWERRIELSQKCVYIPSVKTLLGTNWKSEIAGQEWTAVSVATEIFKMLKKTVLNRSDVEMDRAEIAIPIGFPAVKRRALREAASAAGIEILSFVSEPTAAFFANYKELKSDSIVAIFDWGGGTLDASILRHSDGKIAELATSGMNKGGDILDRKIAEKIHGKLARKKGINLSFDDMPASSKDMLIVRCERAKRAFLDDETATISVNSYGEFGAVRETLDYDWFSEIISPEVDEAIKCLSIAIDNSGVGLANIDRIVLVGGSSNLRPLIEKMDRLFGEKLYFPEETMWNVGLGAALLSINPGSYFSNQTIGIELSNGALFPLLKPDASLKKWSTNLRFGVVDSSKEARFVFGGSPDLENSGDRYKSLSIPAYLFLQEQITLEAIVDQDLIFYVSARSNMQSESFVRFWEYDRLKFYYKVNN